VTDAGSTKSRIVNQATEKLSGCHFIGGHPMAGKETRGVESAEADLFRNRTYVLTPRSEADLSTRQTRNLVSWLEKIGARCIFLTSQEHDRTVALTSHLPQLASSALASTLAAQLPSDELFEAAGPGLVDATRLALSPFEIWRDILITNRSDIDFALGMYIDKLQEFRENLTNLQLREDFEAAAGAAKRIRRGRRNP
jgi:prephenate dehydrogenase